jgi:hypothetical protein
MSDLTDLAALADRAGVPLHDAEHYAPLLRLVAALAPAAAPEPLTLDLTGVPEGFDLWRAHTVEEAAAFLGLKRTNTLYEIPEAELPRCRVGPTRSAVRYFGLDLFCYLKRLPMVDAAAVRNGAVDARTAWSRAHVVSRPG